MADLLGDGNVKVTFCLTLSSTSNPPADECNAGVDLQEVLTKDGLDISPEQASVDNTNLASRDETEDAGSVKYSLELTVKIQEEEADDVGTTTLVDRQKGFLVVRRNRPHEEDYEVGDPVEVYPVRCGRQRKQPPALNTPQTFKSKLFNYATADSDATVAA
ncbi:phage tail tube protein [Microbispora rosea]|uniref:phage tail tube protein n=1 Tax=Microbispora rosea TaxID=58117 RepID=UPI0037B7F68B